MEILHVLGNISGTTIPVEIASATDRLSGIDVRMVSNDPLPEELPDTVEEYQVLDDLCDFENFGKLLDAVENEFDAIHTHTVVEAAKAGFRAVDRPIHHVNTQHGHSHYTLTHKVGNLPGLLFADTIVYNSNYTSTSYNAFERALKFRADEYVVHNGVNMDVVEPYRASITTPPTIVAAARLIERKNLDILIRALAHADRTKLRVVGDGPQRTVLEREAEAAGVSSRVEFLGYLPHREDVYEELEAADVFVLPSQGEGFCVAVAEAMAVGLPVVVSDLPVFHEVVGESGIYVDHTSPKAIAVALEDLFADLERAKRLGTQNRARIRERFTLKQCARSYRDVYEQVLDSDRPRSAYSELQDPTG